MKIYRKTYGVRNLVEWQANIPVGKGRLIVHFTGGSITAYGVTPAVFKTEDPIHQAIIENSGYFKSGRIFLMKSDFIKEVADPVPAAPAAAPAPAASPAPAAATVVSAPAPAVQAPAPAAAPAPTVEEKTETKQEPAKEEAPAAPAETTTPAAPAEETKQDPGTAPAPETVQTPAPAAAPAPAASPAPAGDKAEDDEDAEKGGAVEAGTDEEGFKIVKASCFEDVRQYLIKNYGFTPSAVRTKALAKAKATANKVKFLIDGKELA